jgi:hypothetical protein
MTNASLKLSETMIAAIKFAHTHEGKLERFPGGFWGASDAAPFGTKTVEGLLSRGQGTYTKWKEGKNGQFPIEFTLARPR